MNISPIRFYNVCNFKAQNIKSEEEKLEQYRKEADIILQDGWVIPFEIDEEIQQALAPELDPIDYMPRGCY